MFKKCTAILLAMVLVLGCFPVKAFAAAVKPAKVPENVEPTGTTEDGLTYTIITAYQPNYVIINSYTGDSPEVIIPEKIEGLIVKEIGGSAFDGCSNVTSITIPNGVTRIDDWAFDGCSSLTSIILPSGLTNLGVSAFEDCSSLTSITLPNGVSIIDDYAFSNCSSLTSITLPSGLTGIRSFAFYNCSSLTSITLPSGVKGFSGDAFLSCDSLTSIQVEPDNTTLCSLDGIVYSKDMTRVVCCPNGKQGEITLPDSVTNIDYHAFHGCGDLTSITLPSGVTEIRGYAFCGCINLKNITLSDKVSSIDEYAFWGCRSLTNITLPSDLTNIGYYAFNGCSSLTSIVLPSGVTSIGSNAFEGCSNLCEIKFTGNAPEFGYYVFTGVTATAYYPANDATWTTDVMRDYGGTITWVPYDPDGGETPAPAVDTHDTIDELTELDYLALSKVSYWDFDTHKTKTLEQALTDMGYWDTNFESTDIKVSELCASIAHWTVADVDNYSNDNGFYGVTFANGDDAVIAYRGSYPLSGLDDLKTKDAIYDWVLNDLYPIILNRIFDRNQYQNAMTMYENTAKTYSNIAVTGHSLGGGLADMVSAHYGCRGVSMNAISILDAFYTRMPKLFGASFTGVDEWNFMDHANQYDLLAGAFEIAMEPLGGTKIKPVTTHESNRSFSYADLIYYHGLGSYVSRNADDVADINDKVGSFTPNSVISNNMLTTGISLDLGTSKNDMINKGLSIAAARTTYGGSGCDTISSNIWSDTLIGGKDYDELDGSWGDDTYAYYKGDGVDTIRDVGGDDTLVLLGFNPDDSFSVMVDSGDDYVHIRYSGETIIKISKKNREYAIASMDSFRIVVDYQIEGTNPEIYDITDAFYKYMFGERLTIGCPVSVEVLDPNGTVVHTLTDGEVGAWYTDYGNFYVFEEESGEYGKILDLVEGYTARIVGAGEGTMDVTYQVPVDGELTDPVSISDVPVTDSLIAAVEENEDGDVYLVIDEDGDGETDTIRQLRGENPFTDVPEGSFYYESVMWAVENGVTNGLTETTFGPNEVCNRAQVVTFLWRAAGSPEPTVTEHPFVDVSETAFYYKAMLWAVENGITTGTDAAHFSPSAACNRATVVTFLHRAAGAPALESDGNPFTDVNTGSWYGNAVLWAVEKGITNGLTADTFGPTTNCNRAQVVTFLYRAYTE